MKEKTLIGISIVSISAGIDLQVSAAKPKCTHATTTCSIVTCYQNQTGTWDSCLDWESDKQTNGSGNDALKIHTNCGIRMSGEYSCSDMGAGCGGFAVNIDCDPKDGGGE